MPDLNDELFKESKPVEPQYKPPAASSEYDGSVGYIQTVPLTGIPSHDEILREWGYDPNEVAIVGNPRVSRWQQKSKKDSEPIWLQAYKFTIVPKLNAAMPDIEALVAWAKAKKPQPATTVNPYWFVFQAGDQQLGKRSREGSTEQIVQRFLESVEGARNEFKSLKRYGIEGIQISMPGDCIEGNQSQGGRNVWLTQEAITEQVRIFRRLLYHTVERLAPLADQVIVTVVNGNHDEADRRLNYYPGDGWATHTAEAVAERMADNPGAFGHVKMICPDKWRGAVTVEVGDTVVGIVHGHQWGKNKSFDWLANQAVNRHPVGGAQVLQHGHYHEWSVRTNKHVTIVQSPTFEVASDYLIDKQGSTAKRGAVIYLVRAGEISKMSLV